MAQDKYSSTQNKIKPKKSKENKWSKNKQSRSLNENVVNERRMGITNHNILISKRYQESFDDYLKSVAHGTNINFIMG